MTEIPQIALRARQRYVDGEPVEAILLATKLSLKQFYHWLDGAPQPDGTALLPPIPRRHVFRKRSPTTAREREKLIARIMRAAERQVQAIEERCEAAGIEPTERDSEARALAVLARTMRELTELDEVNCRRKATDQSRPPNDEPIPRNIDELRESLLRKLEALVAEEEEEARLSSVSG